MEVTTLCYIEEDGKYLMLNRTKKKEDINNGKWIGVGGHIEEGETPNECVKREVYEETGLVLEDFRLRGLLTFVQYKELVGEKNSNDSKDNPAKNIKMFTEYIWLYTADKYSGSLKECDEGELSWIDKKDIFKLNLWEGDKVFLKLLDEKQEYFSLKLEYKNDDLIRVLKE